MEVETGNQANAADDMQEIVVHSGTYEGTILGFSGTLKKQNTLYAYTPNWVN